MLMNYYNADTREDEFYEFDDDSVVGCLKDAYVHFALGLPGYIKVEFVIHGSDDKNGIVRWQGWKDNSWYEGEKIIYSVEIDNEYFDWFAESWTWQDIVDSVKEGNPDLYNKYINTVDDESDLAEIEEIVNYARSCYMRDTAYGNDYTCHDFVDTYCSNMDFGDIDIEKVLEEYLLEYVSE